MRRRKRKVLLIENARRGWLMNIINFYGLLFVLPYYVLGLVDTKYMFAYFMFLVSGGALLAARLSMCISRRFESEVYEGMSGRMLPLVYLSLYGHVIPHVSLIFIPIMIVLSLMMASVGAPMYLRLLALFVVFFILILIFTYRNLRVVNTEMREILRYVRSGR